MIPLLTTRMAQPSLVLDFLAGTLDARIAFTRASTASYTDNAGTLRSVAIDTPRFDTDPATLLPRGLLAEEQRTNQIRNPRAEGATVGTIGAGGVLPTNWGRYATAGLSSAVVAVGTESGIPYCDIRWWGTATGTASATCFPEPATVIAGGIGQSWTASMFCTLVGGSLAGASSGPALNVIEYTATGVYVVGSGVGFTPIAAALATQRRSYTRMLTGDTTNFVGTTIATTFPTGAVVDFTLRIGVPQLEQGPFASSPILPPAGTLAASTRAADIAKIAGADFAALYNPVACTVVTRFQSFGAANSFVLRVSDLGYSNGLSFGCNSGTVLAQAVVAGTPTLSPGGMPARTAAVTNLAGALASDDAQAAVNGTTVTRDSAGAMPPGMVQANLGSDHLGFNNLNGWIQRLVLYPSRIPDTMLRSLSA
ncbi:MAG: hypothetical protein BGP12_09635 [Rhodospirillales bacterium 70-18]|nr:MAG: hypothetical protein BGP12_09635 [Rhodospirillales bacterium 70-18]